MLSTRLRELIDGLAELAAEEFLTGGRVITGEPERPTDFPEADQ
jgi:hypothetical protein